MWNKGGTSFKPPRFVVQTHNCLHVSNVLVVRGQYIHLYYRSRKLLKICFLSAPAKARVSCLNRRGATNAHTHIGHELAEALHPLPQTRQSHLPDLCLAERSRGKRGTACRPARSAVVHASTSEDEDVFNSQLSAVPTGSLFTSRVILMHRGKCAALLL